MDGDGGRVAGGGPLRVGACLSLSGRYARFGSQAVRALQAWAALDGDAGLVLEDDRSDPGMLQALLPTVAAGCDVLLGPYSTQLARVAGKMAAAAGWLVWNHGGSGDDVQAVCPGHAVSLPTPASRYAGRFIRDVLEGAGLELWIVQGKGSFGRQVADGAQQIAEQAGASTRRLGTGDAWPCPPGSWALVSAGTFEDDVQAVNRALRQRPPPRLIFSVAAGVREFADEVDDPEGIYGPASGFPVARPGLSSGRRRTHSWPRTPQRPTSRRTTPAYRRPRLQSSRRTVPGRRARRPADSCGRRPPRWTPRRCSAGSGLTR